MTSSRDTKISPANVRRNTGLPWSFTVFNQKRRFVMAVAAVAALSACGALDPEKPGPPSKSHRAAARFEELCKRAGMRVTRTVDDVRSLVLVKIRPKLEIKDYYDPMLPGAAMAVENKEGSYIESFLGVETPPEQQYGSPSGGRKPPTAEEIVRRNLRGGVYVSPDRIRSGRPRYEFVEAFDPVDGRWYAYTPIVDGTPTPPRVKRAEIKGPTARYAVDYEDLVDPEDRDLWIAGTVIRMIDRQTGELLAEYAEYAFDPGMGSGAGGRSPWQYAGSHGQTRCPRTEWMTHSHTRYIVDQVLKPQRGATQ